MIHDFSDALEKILREIHIPEPVSKFGPFPAPIPIVVSLQLVLTPASESDLIKMDSLLYFLKHDAKNLYSERLLLALHRCHSVMTDAIFPGFHFSSFWSEPEFSAENQGYSVLEQVCASFLYVGLDSLVVIFLLDSCGGTICW